MRPMALTFVAVASVSGYFLSVLNCTDKQECNALHAYFAVLPVNFRLAYTQLPVLIVNLHLHDIVCTYLPMLISADFGRKKQPETLIRGSDHY
jgi:hypothetical protein